MSAMKILTWRKHEASKILTRIKQEDNEDLHLKKTGRQLGSSFGGNR
jgi:sugar (pentulose or hexulose) kinase